MKSKSRTFKLIFKDLQIKLQRSRNADLNVHVDVLVLKSKLNGQILIPKMPNADSAYFFPKSSIENSGIQNMRDKISELFSLADFT